MNKIEKLTNEFWNKFKISIKEDTIQTKRLKSKLANFLWDKATLEFSVDGMEYTIKNINRIFNFVDYSILDDDLIKHAII